MGLQENLLIRGGNSAGAHFLPFALPLLPAWNLRKKPETKQPFYDCEETKTHTKDSRVEILSLRMAS